QVAEAEIARVVGVPVLAGGFQRPAEGTGAESALAAPAQAEGAAGGTGEVAVVQPVAVADQGAGGTGPGGVEEMRVELAFARQRIAGLVTGDAVHPAGPGIAERQRGRRRVFQQQGVEGLLVLSPADVADEALVVQQQALPAEGGRQALAPPAQPGTVDLQGAG